MISGDGPPVIKITTNGNFNFTAEQLKTISEAIQSGNTQRAEELMRTGMSEAIANRQLNGFPSPPVSSNGKNLIWCSYYRLK